MAGALERARADADAGRLWQARDRLVGYLGTEPRSQEALRLLGEIYARMGDLPAAGRYWYLTEDGGGAEGEAARQAFERRCGGHPAQMLQALPARPPLERYPPAVQERVGELVRAASEQGFAWGQEAKAQQLGAPAPRDEWLFLLVVLLLTVGVWLLGIAFLVLLAVRLVT